jgi:small-conductance mechanosensitive channel
MNLAVWKTTFASAAAELVTRVVAYVPSLVAAAGLVLLGYLVAWASRALLTRALTGSLSLAARRVSLGQAIERTRLGPRFIAVLSGVVFWFILALFVAAAVERLQLTIAASLVGAFVVFMPRVLVAIVLVFSALVAGHVAYGGVQRAASIAGMAQATLLGRAVQMILVFFGIVTAADQLGIQSTLLTVVVATAVGAVLGGATLAFGLGSRVAVSNIVSVFYLLKTYRVGQVVRIGDVEGPIVEITQTSVFIDTPAGRVLVPGRCFSETASTLIAGSQS